MKTEKTKDAFINLNPRENCLEITGALTIKTIIRLRQTSYALLKKSSIFRISLKGVTHYDSAALALFTALARDARKMGKQVSFLDIPPQLLEIAKLSNLDKVLNLQ